MALNFKSLKGSPTGKRFDLVVDVTGLFIESYRLELRIISRQAIDEDKAKDLVRQVIERQKEAVQGKEFLSLNLNSVNANAYFKIKKSNDE